MKKVMLERTGRIFLHFSFSHFSAKTCSEFSVQLIQDYSPSAGLSNGVLKIKIRFRLRVSNSAQS